MEQKTGTRSVDRMLDILECFDVQRTALGVQELSDRTALANATVYRIVQTLAARGYLRQDALTKKYTIGAGFLSLGKLFLNDLDLLQIARPHMDSICHQLNETVKLYLWNGNDRICIRITKSMRELQSQTKVGDKFSLNRGAGGKVILAFSGAKDSGVEEAELELIREQGYAVGHGERVSGVSSVGVALLDHRAQVVGSMVISGPTYRFVQMDLTAYSKMLLEAGYAISRELGYRR